METPSGIAALPHDKHHRPIPWFVHRDDHGTPDFRVIRRGGVADALRFGLCWVCGRPRGRHAALMVGPMCAINRVSPDPPLHLPCAVYSARVCPFLATPTMRRRDRDLPEGHRMAEGAITRNPGCVGVWSSRTWAPIVTPGGDVLLGIGEPTSVSWWSHGRPATRAEVLESIETGLPILREVAERDGPDAVAELERLHQLALPLLPVAV